MTLTRHLQRAWDRDGTASLQTARAAFAAEYGKMDELRREQEIAALPRVVWKGKALHTLRCQGDFGKGPHDMNVPEALLWNLIDLRRFLCPYHR